jgi:hypothetical protein
LTYRHSETGVEVGVEPVPPGKRFALFVEDSADVGTGLAIFKPDAPSEIEFRIRDEAGSDPVGEVLTRGDFRQSALTLPEWLQGTDRGFLQNFRGLLFLRATNGASFAPVGLRFGRKNSSLSAVPVVPIPDEGEGTSRSIGKMYWSVRAMDQHGPKIQRANLDGTQIEDLVTTRLSLPVSLALDPGGGKMYWTTYYPGKIQRANLDGWGMEALVTGLGEPHGLALDLDAGKMYWTAPRTSKIQRANLDGTQVEDLVTVLDAPPVALALDLSGRPE